MSTPLNSSGVWFVLASDQRARLFQMDIRPPGHPHIEECDAIEFEWEGREHGRPALSDRRGHSYAVSSHEADEDRHRFVRQLVRWLPGAMQSHAIDRLTLFAPPKTVGVLRELCPAPLAQKLNIVVKELVNHRIEALQKDADILGLMGLSVV